MLGFYIFYIPYKWVVLGDHDFIRCKEMLYRLVQLSNPIQGAEHTWYLYTYILMLAFSPFVNVVVQYVDHTGNLRKYLLILLIVTLLINDVSNNNFASFSNDAIRTLPPSYICVIKGHIYYEHRAYFMNKTWMLRSMILYFLLNIARTKLQYASYVNSNGTHILYWYTLVGVICAGCILVFVDSFCNSIRLYQKTKICNIILILAQMTFGIYLIHPCVRDTLYKFGVIPYVNFLLYNDTSFVADIMCTIVNIILVFGISLCVVLLIYLLNKNTRCIKYYVSNRGINNEKRTK